MCFVCSKEPSHQGGSFEYPQHMFRLRNKKNNFQLHTLIWRPGRVLDSRLRCRGLCLIGVSVKSVSLSKTHLSLLSTCFNPGRPIPTYLKIVDWEVKNQIKQKIHCGHLKGKGLPVGSLVCDVFLCFCHFPMWCPGSGVVLDCIDF